MQDRLSEGVKRAVVAARAEAEAMGHGEVGDDHLLLAVAMGNDLAAEIIGRCVSVRALHDAVAAAHAPRAEVRGEADTALQRVWPEALRHSAGIGMDEIDTMTLLLGIVDVDGDAVRALRGLEVDVIALATELERAAEATRPGSPDEELVDVSASTTFSARMAKAEPSGAMRPWPSPRCHGCRKMIRDHVQLRTLDVPDQVTGEVQQYRFLYCGACGTAFAIERIER